MNQKLFDKLLNDATFLSLFYQARELSESSNIDLVSAFMQLGLNKYRQWLFYLCDHWGIDNLFQVVEFDRLVRGL